MLKVEKSTQKLIFENALKNIKWSIKPFRCGRPSLSSLSVGSQISSEKGSILLFYLLEPEILNLLMPPKPPRAAGHYGVLGAKKSPAGDEATRISEAGAERGPGLEGKTTALVFFIRTELF